MLEGGINLLDCKEPDLQNYNTYINTKRKSSFGETAQKKHMDKVYKVKHNNSKKRSTSKSKSKQIEPKYQLSNYVAKLKTQKGHKRKGLSTRDQCIKLSHMVDLNTMPKKGTGSKEKRKKSSEDKKYL